MCAVEHKVNKTKYLQGSVSVHAYVLGAVAVVSLIIKLKLQSNGK